MPSVQILLGENQVLTTTVPIELYQALLDARTTYQLPVTEGEDGRLTLTFHLDYHSIGDRVRYRYTTDRTLMAVGASGEGEDAPFPPGEPADRYQVQDRSIVLLLESPHTEEWRARYPAAGQTGTNIHTYLPALQNLLREVWPDRPVADTPLVICNPSPLPASCLLNLGVWGDWRDMVFEALMLRPELQTHFRNRLVRYNPAVIINCCTDGVPLAHAFVRQPGEPTDLPAGPFQAASPKQIVSRLVDHKLAPRLFDRHYYTKKKGRIEFHSSTPAVQFDNAAGHVVNLSHPSRAWSREAEEGR